MRLQPRVSLILWSVLLSDPMTPAAAAALQPVETQEPADSAAKSVTREFPGGVPHFRYQSKGRRDPFRPLDAANVLPARPAPVLRPRGLKGQLVSEMNLVGWVEAGGEFTAIASGTGAKTYFLRRGDRLYDGKVVEVGKASVIFSRTLTDSVGTKIRQRVVKKLHPTPGEGGDGK